MTLRGGKPYRTEAAFVGLGSLQTLLGDCLGKLELILHFPDYGRLGQELMASFPEPNQWQIQTVYHSGLEAMASSYHGEGLSAGSQRRMSCILAILGDLECLLRTAEVGALGAGPRGCCDGFP